MTDRPVLFSGPMVRALLNGRKTQTRRVLRATADGAQFIVPELDNDKPHISFRRSPSDHVNIPCFAPGDRLWVREAWRTGLAYEDLKPSEMGGEEYVFYEADGKRFNHHPADSELGRLRPGMFMPRWASRITLTVTNVGVQRVRSISYDDLIAEGAQTTDIYKRREAACRDDNVECGSVTRDSFAELWDSINAARGHGWADNPWVVAYTFTVQNGNIDEVATP